MPEQASWVLVDRAAQQLGAAEVATHRLIGSRELLAHGMSRLWKFELSDLDGWVRQGGAADGETR